jgi:ATP-dependent Clp protease adaptor protein ClpS
MAKQGKRKAVAEPEVDEQQQAAVKSRDKTKRQPRYHVILWDDDDHTYDYVIRMMAELFRHTKEKGMQIATEVDSAGRAVCLTTTMEHAELKRDQIHAFGRDELMDKCQGSMKATIEPAESSTE